MTVVGEAFINIVAKTDGFAASLKAQTEGGLQALEADADKAGTEAGGLLGGGIGRETTKGLDDVEKDVGGRGQSIGGKLAGGLSGALSNVGSMLGADFLGPVTSGVDKAGEHMDTAKGKSSGFGSSLQSLGGGIALGAAAGIAAFSAEGVKLGLTMESTDSKIAASAGISQSAAKQIGDAFLGTAGTTTFSGQEMATAYASVAGQLTLTEGHALSSADALKVMSAATSEAEATGQSLDTTTGALSKVMQAFHLSAGDAAAASDTLYEAAKGTGQGVDTLAQQLGKLHSSLGDNAPSLQDSSALLVDFAKNGVTGRGAMTALTSSLTALIDPTTKQKAALQAMGVSLTDANGKFIGIGPAMQALSAHAGANASAQDQAAMATLFSGKTLSQITPLLQQGASGFDTLSAKVNEHGAAEHAAETASNNLHGQMEKLGAAVKDQATQWGEVLIPILTKVVGILVKVATYVIEHKALLIALAAVVGGIVVTAFVAWAASLWATVAAATVLGAPVLAVAAAIAAVIAIVVLLATHWKQVWGILKDVVHDAWQFIDGIFHDIEQAVSAVVDWIKSHWQLLLAILAGPFGIAVLLIKGHFTQISHAASDVVDAVVHFFSTLPSKIASFFVNIWNTVWSAFIKVGDWLDSNVLAPVISFFEGMPGKIGKMFVNIYDTIWADWKKVLMWIVTNVETPTLNWAKALPAKIYRLFVNIYDTIFADWKRVATWLYTNVESPVINWALAIPGKIAGALGDIIGTAFAGLTAIGGWLESHVGSPVWGFFTGLPGRAAGALGDIIGTVFASLTNIGSWLEQHVWQPAWSFFSGLPGRIGQAVGNLLGDITGSVGGVVGKALSIVGLAVGGVVNKPTLAVVGESGPEVVLPLTNPSRMAEILSTLPHNLFPGGGGGVTSATGGAQVSTSSPVVSQPLYVSVNNNLTVSSDVSDTAMAQIQRMFENNNRDLAQRIGALR